MNTRSLLFAALFFGTLGASRLQSQGFFTNGLAAYYPLAGNANLATGQGSNGVLNGSTIQATTNRFGFADGALHFGGGSYISVTPTPFNVLTNWTISLWCIFQGTNSAENLVSTGHDTSGGVNFRFVGYTAEAWQFGGGTEIPVYYSAEVTNNPLAWNMMTGVNNGTSFQLFLNDQLVASNSLTGPPLDAGSLWFGRHEDSDSFAFYDLVGSMSDVRIYNRALAASEVQQLYQFEAQAPCTPHRATATAQLVSGIVTGATITDPGCSYTNAPLVLVLGGGGTGATATATVNNGEVTGITMTDTGSGYTSPPTIYIYSPSGPQIGLVKAVAPSFTDLVVGQGYQLQISLDMTNWIDQGAPFTATNPVAVYSEYFDLSSNVQLYFRLQAPP